MTREAERIATSAEWWVAGTGGRASTTALANMIDAALAAARADGERDMRERAAKVAEDCDTLGPTFSDVELTEEGLAARLKVKQIASAIRALKDGT